MIWEIKSRFIRNKVIKFFRSDLVDNYKFRGIMVCYNYCIEVISMM
jgi:adenine-specific DNA methylase